MRSRSARAPPLSAQASSMACSPSGAAHRARVRSRTSSWCIVGCRACVGGTWPLSSNRRHGQPVHRDPLVATSSRGARGHAATLMGRPSACASPRAACDALRARMATLCVRSSPGAADECVPRRALAARGAICPSPITCARGELPSCAASDRKLLVARCVWSAAQRARALDGSVYCVLPVCVWLAHASVE